MLNLTTISVQGILDVSLLAIVGFGLSLLITPIYTRLAFTFKWWKRPRTTAVTGEKSTIFTKLHEEKHRRHIPTMAGLVMVIAISLVTIALNFSRSQTLLPLVALCGAGLVGLIDDVINLRGTGGGVAGLRSQLKFLLITAVALLGGWYFAYKLNFSILPVPFIEEGIVIGGFGYIALFVIVLVSAANAVNITDGLDGLAGGLLTNAFAAYAVIALIQGNIGIAGFCATVVGTLLAYTWFNVHPARFFMGDIGSFALGTALGVVAMLTGGVFLLPVIGIVFVLEAGSSLLQILSKRLRGRKIFRVAPLHHHFEAIGWPESKITMRFWILGQVAAVAGVAIAAVGGLL